MNQAAKKLSRIASRLYTKHITKLADNAEAHRQEIVSALTQTLTNASTNSSLGIIPFVKMVQADGIVLTFDVTRNDSLGSRTITVDNIQVQPADKAYLQPKYQPLKDQVEAYLKRNWEVYPSSGGGERIEYSNFTAQLTFGQAQPAQIISQN